MMTDDVSEITDEAFEREVIGSSVPVLVDFWAPWCKPCAALSPALHEVQAERGEKLRVVKVNIEQNGRAQATYRVMSLPTLMLFENGEMIRAVVGPSGKAGIDAFLDQEEQGQAAVSGR
jgi:thioredoxin 1